MNQPLSPQDNLPPIDNEAVTVDELDTVAIRKIVVREPNSTCEDCGCDDCDPRD